MKTEAIEKILLDLDKGRMIMASTKAQAREELTALTRLARLVQNEDGTDGKLVEALARVIVCPSCNGTGEQDLSDTSVVGGISPYMVPCSLCEGEEYMPDEMDDDVFSEIKQALAEARQAMEGTG